ncbi:MAG: tetratricopeptide repeat protein [Gammaproteobacteria bacterium]
MTRHGASRGGNRHDTGKLAEQAAAHLAAGHHAAAEKTCRRALARARHDADLWHLLAAILLDAGALAPATDAVMRARQLRPDDPDYANTRALIEERAGRPDDAVAAWRRLLVVAPDHADAWFNLGRVALARAEHDEALRCFLRAVELKPRWGDAYRNLGVACFQHGDAAGAEEGFKAALRCNPADHDSLQNLARLRQDADDVDTAQRLYAAALALVPDGVTALRAALAMPIFADDCASLEAARARSQTALAALADTALRLDDPPSELGAPAFYAAYQGLDDRPYMSALGDLVARAWRPKPPRAVARSSQPRVVVVSSHFKEHTIARLYAPLLEQLPRTGFELAVLSIGEHHGPLATRIARAADHHQSVAEDLDAARTALAALAPDVVFYTDVGMDPWSYYLAAERLAPVQCVGWGHPVTTGLPTMDYFLSSRLVEPAGAAAHYRETLIELPCWPVLYDTPAASPAPDRAAFGFGAAEHVYLCPQSLFKLHPDIDATFAALLATDPRGTVVLIESRPAWRARLAARFARSLGKLATRVRFVPSVRSEDFAGLLAAADVVLDTPHFSGGYTSYETLWAGTPFVTLRGAYMRGRVTAGLCDLLDLDDLVASDAEDYAARAVTLANDVERADATRARIAARRVALLELADSVLPAYEGFFLRALHEAAQRRSRETAA